MRLVHESKIFSFTSSLIPESAALDLFNISSILPAASSIALSILASSDSTKSPIISAESPLRASVNFSIRSATSATLTFTAATLPATSSALFRFFMLASRFKAEVPTNLHTSAMRSPNSISGDVLEVVFPRSM